MIKLTKKKKWSIFGLIAIFLAIFAFLFWQRKNVFDDQGNGEIVIGSKNFTESKVVMQIWTDALEKEGFSVKTKPNISSSVIYQAIKTGQINLYPEYTGTIAATYLDKDLIGKNASQVAEIAAKGMQKNNLTVLNYAPGNDAQGLVIRADVAKKYGIKNISDLQKNAEKIRFVSQGEFDKREDGVPGLEKTYGKFNFKSHKVYDQSLKYEILANNEGDLIPASTTEGQLATGKYLVLNDNKHFWPAYNLVPLISNQTLQKYPKVREILDKIDKKLTTQELRTLNKRVDVDGENYQTVARDWVQKNL